MSVEPQPLLQPERLKAAIACLDLSLESELALYRSRQSQESVALALLPSAAEDSQQLSSDLALEEFSVTDRPELIPQAAIDSGILSEEDKAVLVQGATTAEEEDLDTLPESYSAELTAQPKAFDQFLDPSIEDYLESSEALLKHLDEPAEAEPAPAAEMAKPSKRSWFVVSGLTLIILGTLALGGFLVILAVRWFSKPSLAPAPQSLVSPSPQSAASGLPLPSSTIASRQESAPEGLPTKPLGSSAQNAAAPSSASPTPPIARNAARYIVLASANGLESLQEAQRLVPDAFITEVKGQRRIQLASLDSLQQAQQMINELKDQGFPASIVAQN